MGKLIQWLEDVGENRNRQWGKIDWVKKRASEEENKERERERESKGKCERERVWGKVRERVKGKVRVEGESSWAPRREHGLDCAWLWSSSQTFQDV